jgi:hypothetical protein
MRALNPPKAKAPDTTNPKAPASALKGSGPKTAPRPKTPPQPPEPDADLEPEVEKDLLDLVAEEVQANPPPKPVKDTPPPKTTNRVKSANPAEPRASEGLSDHLVSRVLMVGAAIFGTGLLVLLWLLLTR